MTDVAVALIIFNRPDSTRQVFGEIARARPNRLFVIADGPRPDRPQDVELCAATRALTEAVDWDCEVLRNYADANLGCGLRPASGIDWVFEHVEEAIILEDDCLPRPSFFMFCEELLKRYRDDERVMMIGGRYHQYRMRAWSRRFQHSYAFAYSHTNWGWATWKRAWQHFDMEVRQWPALRETPWLYEMFGDQRVVDFWGRIFDEAYASGRAAHFWDYQWTFACFARRGLAILPRTHMVTNVGFGPDATHTRRLDPDRELGALLTSDMVFPLVHPPEVVRNEALDRLTSAALVDRRQRGLGSRVRRRLRSVVAQMRTVLQ